MIVLYTYGCLQAGLWLCVKCCLFSICFAYSFLFMSTEGWRNQVFGYRAGGSGSIFLRHALCPLGSWKCPLIKSLLYIKKSSILI